MILAQRPKCAFNILSVNVWGKFLFETFHLLLTQAVKVITVLLGNMEAVNNQTAWTSSCSALYSSTAFR